ncbi:MAG: hypothetical protein A3A98_01190 [Candidatus Staskawiczbacteria bacterium RIFCSPLOWO2_01_FULL_40_39]|uniref:Uncharacterized protein n=1 Tax=Candidatus Staskawiczbacteria bacterium RIFCSPHIGHO2_01_FULL_39_25 TaxID=1802202 RepID=A0A1G2HMX9_9BACT|nr:MAG: hypothetical protein A2730_01190 [Candidatus Staskawiczbacteria bacterium RIFCSPHIGHO2_01_FULL_39_25]OGZ73342.1 MAG: hypothetical protein A3A98_01190 [Candidatus Staskawiczbacteria bacterium RIFCSPLOWO2_01_FULL_40_39]OGZ76848.1 MAG: hypothetical protein A3I87_01885 [Candidatus Staskawiczbacteria bacterium RIFCSPLOWO2_02_FULL_39_8]
MDFEKILNVGLSHKYISHENFTSSRLEDFLNWLNKEKGYLFHGSGTLIPQGEKLISGRGIFHATDDGGVAIIKALFPNNLPGQTNLDYRLNKGNSQEVIIEGKPEGEVIRQKGYIYVLEGVGFSNEDTQGVAEYIKPLSKGKEQDYLFVIEVKKRDFNYSYKVIDK